MYHIKTFFFGILGNFWFGGIFLTSIDAWLVVFYVPSMYGILWTILGWYVMHHLWEVFYGPSIGGLMVF